ncbi:hypothetical protein DMP17_22240 [Pseudonocardia sp. TMWB2A]
MTAFRPGAELDPVLAEQLKLLRARVDRYLVWLQYALASTNLIAAIALLANAPGLSPAMLFLQVVAPLPVWSVLPALAAVLLLLGAVGFPVQPYAHAVGMFVWAAITVGTVMGLATATTTSPSASLLLTGLLTGTTAWHAGALLFRRRLARLR